MTEADMVEEEVENDETKDEMMTKIEIAKTGTVEVKKEIEDEGAVGVRRESMYEKLFV